MGAIASWTGLFALLLSFLIIWIVLSPSGLTLFGWLDRKHAQERHRQAVDAFPQDNGAGLLLQVLTDLEADLETMVRHCDFEGVSGDLILKGWRESKGGFEGMKKALRSSAMKSPLKSAGLTGPAMVAKASLYYYWRAMAGLDLAVDTSVPPPRPRPLWENKGNGAWKPFRRGAKRHGPKALRIGNIIADSAIAVLDAPVMKAVGAATDVATVGGASVVGKSVKLAAHGTSEIKKIIEEAKITKVHKGPKEA